MTLITLLLWANPITVLYMDTEDGTSVVSLLIKSCPCRGPAMGFTVLHVTVHKGCLMHFLASRFLYDFTRLEEWGGAGFSLTYSLVWGPLPWAPNEMWNPCPSIPDRPLVQDWKGTANTNGAGCHDYSDHLWWFILQHNTLENKSKNSWGNNPQPAFRKVIEVSFLLCWIAGRQVMFLMSSGGNGQQQRFRAGATLLGFCWKK